MDITKALAEFDQTVRRRGGRDGSGASWETSATVTRRVAAPGLGGSGVFWSGLDEASADEVIAGELAFFAGRGEGFEWKLYDYDRPADLGARLVGAGASPGPPEALMFAEVRDVLAATAGLTTPAGVTVVPVTDPDDARRVVAVQDSVFGNPDPRRAEEAVARLAAGQDEVTLVAALAGSEPVAGARVDFTAGSSFAGLFGGVTVPRWRGQGIYRALVRYRAELAASRGYRYLYVDALPTSRPILERAGFSRVATTTPHEWSPAAAR